MKFSASLKSDFGQELVIEFQKIPRPKEHGHFCNYWIGNDLRIENSGFEERSIRRIEENLAGIGADAFGKTDRPFFATIVHLHKKAGVGWGMAVRRRGQGKKQRNYDACPLIGERTPLVSFACEISNKPTKVNEPFTGNKRKPRLKFNQDERNSFKSQVRTGAAKQTAGT